MVGAGGIPISFVGVFMGSFVGEDGVFWVLVAAGVRVVVDGGSVVAGRTGMTLTVLVGVGVAGIGEAVSESVAVRVGVFPVGVDVDAPNKPKTSFPNRYPTANMAEQPRMINIRKMGP